MTDSQDNQALCGLLDTLRFIGGTPEYFKGKKFAHLMVHNNQVITSNVINGLEMVVTETKKGVDLDFKMKEGYSFDSPVNICFGVIPTEGEQVINLKGIIESNAKLEFLAYCVFPNAKNVQHHMEGNVQVMDNSSFIYSEVHYHGDNGGISVLPNLYLDLGRNSTYVGNFFLNKGRAGNIAINYDVNAGENSRVELMAKVLASGTDNVSIKEKVTLTGQGSKGYITSRIVGRDDSRSEVISELVALSPECVGHVDCIETILGNAYAKATPLVDVRNRYARVTHEAAIGSLNSKQLQTLMARGLTTEEATDVLIKSLLK